MRFDDFLTCFRGALVAGVQEYAVTIIGFDGKRFTWEHLSNSIVEITDDQKERIEAILLEGAPCEPSGAGETGDEEFLRDAGDGGVGINPEEAFEEELEEAIEGQNESGDFQQYYEECIGNISREIPLHLTHNAHLKTTRSEEDSDYLSIQEQTRPPRRRRTNISETSLLHDKAIQAEHNTPSSSLRDLGMYGLVIHMDLKILICTRCQTALPLSYMLGHIQTGQILGKTFHHGYAQEIAKTGPNRIPQFKEKLDRALKALNLPIRVDDIIDVDGVDPESVARWRTATGTKFIEGVRTISQCYWCKGCGVLSKSKSVRGKQCHNSKEHMKTQWVTVKGQSACETHTAFVRWFPIQDTDQTTPLQPAERSDVQDVFEAMGAEAETLVTNRPNAPHHPFFHEFGIDKFLANFRGEDIAGLFRIDSETQEKTTFRHLIGLFEATFEKDCSLIKEKHPSIRMKLVENVGAAIRRRAPLFTPSPNRTTRRRYYLVQVKLIYGLICHRKEPIISPHTKSTLFHISKALDEALKELEYILSQEELVLDNAQKALYKVLGRLFFPRGDRYEDEVSSNPFMCPVTVFLAALWVNSNGERSSLWSVSPEIAKLQFCIRLAAFHIAVEGLNNKGHTTGNESSTDPAMWIDELTGFTSRYLSEDGVYPFSMVRHHMHQVTKIVKNTSRPALIKDLGNEKILILDHEMSFPQLADSAKVALRDAEAYILQYVLFAKQSTLSTFINDMPFLQGPFGKLLSSVAPFPKSEDESKALLQHLLHHGDLGESGQIDESKCLKWLSSISTAWTMVIPLLHIYQGPPGRGTEEVEYTYSVDQSDGQQNLQREVFQGNHVLVIRADRGKMVPRSGVLQRIVRILPYQLSVVLYILLGVVRPLEWRFATQSWFPVDPEKRSQAISCLQTRIIASFGISWSSDKLSACLAAWFQKYIGTSIGLRIYRHIILFFIRILIKVPETEREDLLDLAEEVSGHTPATGNLNYGITRTGQGEKFFTKYVQLGEAYHTMFGIQTFAPRSSDRRESSSEMENSSEMESHGEPEVMGDDTDSERNSEDDSVFTDHSPRRSGRLLQTRSSTPKSSSSVLRAGRGRPRSRDERENEMENSGEMESHGEPEVMGDDTDSERNSEDDSIFTDHSPRRSGRLLQTRSSTPESSSSIPLGIAVLPGHLIQEPDFVLPLPSQSGISVVLPRLATILRNDNTL
ncbi:hypothetical protein VNI00_017292 [Paramarasmius palmivorus]|uniref:Uncharacterized protein n=1 Tax=Paramarasmius palmivorus TaxID=297713 RepID=A0AAW0B869_9AGAR